MNRQSFLLFFAILFLSIFSLTQCCSSKVTFQDTTPFTITKSFYQSWVGGLPDNSGVIVQLFVSDIAVDVRPDSLFFQKKKTKIDVKTNQQENLWIANFRNESGRDIQMHQDPRKEFENPIPKKEESPFELDEGEVVIRYTKAEKVYYYKISGITQKETVFFPVAKPKN